MPGSLIHLARTPAQYQIGAEVISLVHTAHPVDSVAAIGDVLAAFRGHAVRSHAAHVAVLRPTPDKHFAYLGGWKPAVRALPC